MGESLLVEGLTDAAGFLVGAFLGWWLASLLGFEVATEGYSISRVLGVALVILGGGLGLRLARRGRARRIQREAEDCAQSKTSAKVAACAPCTLAMTT